jgi:flotillin
MYGEGNSAKLAGDVMKTADQVMEAMKESTGLDLSTIVSSFVGAKTAQN